MTTQGTPVVQIEPVIIRRGSIGRVSVQILDCDGNPVDPSSLTLGVYSGDDQPIYYEDYNQILIPPFQHRIVKVNGAVGQFLIDWGNLYFPAQITSTNGFYPTNFMGGEVLGLQIDQISQVVVFQITDQSIQQVAARINSVFGPYFGIQVATVTPTGLLQITSKRRGRGARVL